MKSCAHCRIQKAFDDFHKSKKSPDGRQTWCKLCKSAWRTQHIELTRLYGKHTREKYPDRERARAKAKREKHKIRFHFDETYRLSYKAKRQRWSAAHYKRHSHAIRNRVKEYSMKYKNEIKIYRHQYNQTHKAQRRAYVNQFRKRFGRKPWEGKKKYNHRYYQTHKDKYFNWSAQRRALKQHPGIPAALVNRQLIFRRDNFICHICQRKVKTADLSIDHLIPLSRGGTHTPENLATAHMRCNLSRGPGRLPAQLRLFS